MPDSKLKGSNEYFRQLIENSGDVVWVLDISSLKFTYVSESVKELFGYSAEEMQNKILEEIISPESLKIISNQISYQIQQVKEGNYNTLRTNLELEQYTKDGNLLPTENKTTILLDENNLPVEIIGITRDISARKIIEGKLVAKDEKYQNVLNWSPIGIYHSTREGKILAANRSLAVMLGYEHENELMENATMPDLYDDVEDRNKFIKINLEQGEERLRNIDFKWKKKDGTPIWVLLTAHSIRDEHNKHLYYEGFVQDNDAQKKSNLALEGSLSLLKATLESTNDGILVVNLNGRVTNYNKRFTDLWQIPFTIFDNHDDKEILNYVADKFEDIPGFLDRIRMIYSLPDEDSFDILELIDGRILERYSHPQKLDNIPIGRVWSFRDVTEKVKAEESLKKRENQYRILFEGANDSIFIMSDEKFIDCNEMTLKIFECTSKMDIINHYPWEFSPELQPDGNNSIIKANQYISKALLGEPQRFYWKHKTLNGILIDCEVALSRIHVEEEVILQAIVRDITDRMNSEIAIRESEDRFRRIFEESPIGLILIRADYRFLTCNQAFSKMLHYSSDDLRTMSLLDVTHPDHIDIDLSALSTLKNGEISQYKTETRYINKENNVVWGSLTIATINNSNNEFLYFLGMIEDVTIRKNTETALYESQLQYTSVVENSNDAIIIHQNDKIKFVNAAVSKLTGFSANEFLEISILEFIVPHDRELARLNYQNRLKGLQSPSIYEISLLRKDGKSIPVEINASSILYNQRPAGLIFVRDLSDRKIAEKELHDREFWLSQSQKFARIGTYYLDVQTGIWKCTETLDEIFGITSDAEKSITSWISIIYEDDREEMNTYYLEHVLTQKLPFDKEYRIIRQNDNQIRWVHGRGDLTFNEAGQTLAMLGTISDITERKRMEYELTLARDKAEESSRLKSSLLLNISHELRTPMNGILGFAEILSDSLGEAAQRRMAENILLSGNRLKATLDSIVDLSQVQADAKMMKIERVDVANEIQLILANFNDIARTKNISIETDIEKEVFAQADKKFIGNIIHQLLDNAFKFTDQGRVKVSVYTEASNNKVVISVRDTGIGIAEHHLQLIFDEFRQVSEGMGRSYEGTGLGLTLCKKFVELMKGEITVLSEPGIGSLFSVWLPLDSAEIIDKEVESYPLEKNNIEPLPKYNERLPLVLLVEDQAYNLELIEIYLNGVCETDRALDGMSAVKMAFSKQYDAILMDVNLGPGIDGLEATQKIRNISGYENIPIIAVTGYTTSAEREHILSHGCTHYLAKPYNRVSLVSIVSEVLEIKI